jgi:ankyrin repeat protein
VKRFLPWIAIAPLVLTPAAARAQATERVDFGRDVLPILRQNCVSCHGPSQQMNGFRLDRRSVALRPGSQNIIPGNSGSSRAYLRLLGREFGAAMPPAGRLPSEQIAVLKAWIDQGAPWPDELANELDLPPVDARAAQMVAALRTGDLRTFERFVAEDRTLLNARGPGGASPFMYGAMYADAAALRRWLQFGANANARNDANATPLMWAVHDVERTRALIEHRADVNARSTDGRTPLFLAAGRAGAAPIVKLLLERGANPNVPTRSPADSTPLREAAIAGDADVTELLIRAGADIRASGSQTLVQALARDCSKCLQLVAGSFGANAYSAALIGVATEDVADVQYVLGRGADVNARDPHGRTPLILAASSDLLPVETIRLLVARGADLNARSDTGMTALDYAKLHGNTPIVDLLTKAGALAGVPVRPPTPTLQPSHTAEAAIQRSVPILQAAEASFAKQAGCVSCHNQSLTAMAVGAAQRAGFPVDERKAATQLRTTMTVYADRRDLILQHTAGGGGQTEVSYSLVGLHALGAASDLTTDAMARYVKSRQSPEGYFGGADANTRPPHGTALIGRTALGLRSLQLYAPVAEKKAYEQAVRLAALWLAQAAARTGEDRAFRLLGLAWAKVDRAGIEAAKRDLVGHQRADGGWSDIPSLASGAHATGMTLVALHEAGIPATDPVYRRGVEFLLNTQLADGSWYAATRAVPIQPYFDAGFPHGFDQWISTAATNWATMALVRAARGPSSLTQAAGTP